MTWTLFFQVLLLFVAAVLGIGVLVAMHMDKKLDRILCEMGAIPYHLKERLNGRAS